MRALKTALHSAALRPPAVSSCARTSVMEEGSCRKANSESGSGPGLGSGGQSEGQAWGDLDS